MGKLKIKCDTLKCQSKSSLPNGTVFPNIIYLKHLDVSNFKLKKLKIWVISNQIFKKYVIYKLMDYQGEFIQTAMHTKDTHKPI